MASKNKKSPEEDLGFEPVQTEDIGFEPVESNAAQTMQDVLTTAPQGVTTWADEIQAGAEAILRMGGGEGKTYGEIFDPRVQELRQGIAEARERSPIATTAGEIGTSVATSLLPGAFAAKGLGAVSALSSIPAAGKFGGIGGMALRGAVEGMGAAESTDFWDMAVPAVGGAAAAGAGALAAKGIKTLTTQNPERIRAGVLGARTSQFKEVGIKEREAISKELKDMGLFQKTAAKFDAKSGKWVPKGSTLENIEKPTREKLLERIEDAFSSTQNEKKKLFPQIMSKPVSNKMRLMSKIDGTINKWAGKRSGMAQRRDIAKKEIDAILGDLQEEIDASPNKVLTVEMLENLKQRLDEDVGSYGADPLLGKINDLDRLYKDLYSEINDSIKFEVQNEAYEKLNSIQSKLYTAKKDLKTSMAAEPSFFKLSDPTSWFQSPETQLDIARMAEVSQMPGIKQGLGVLRPAASEAPFEAIRLFDPSIPRVEDRSRNLQSLTMSPKQLISYRIPRSTQGILEQKDKVIAKLAQSGIPSEMIDTVAQALNGDPDDLSSIAPVLVGQFPEIFEKSKYKVFDGKFIDPNDKARAADEISKRDDIDSIKRARMINRINKFGEVPEGL